MLTMLILVAIFVIAVPRVLGIDLRPQVPAQPTRKTLARSERHSSPVEQLRRASTRLVVALLMLAAGTALLVFLTVRWILQMLERILS